MNNLLNNDEIVLLNDIMLGRGAPDEKDDRGYNKPDYCRMIGLGGVPILDDLQAFAILDTLRHYKNTQLTSDGDRIEYTYQHYKSILQEETKKYLSDTMMFRNAFIEYCRENGIRDFIHLVHSDNKGVTIHYDGFVSQLNELKNENKPHIRCIKDGNDWNMYIEWDYMDKFLKCAETAGKRGYTPDEELQKAIDLHDEKMKSGLLEMELEAERLEEQKKLTEKPPIICSFALGTPLKTEDGMYMFNIEKNTSAVRTALFDEIKENHTIKNIQYKVEDIMGNFIRYTDEVSFECNENNLDKLEDFLNNNNCNIRADESVKNFLIEDRKFKTSEIKLIDLDNRPLPFKPYPFQIEDAKRLIEKPRCLIGHDMGTGKTFIAVVIGESVKGKKLVIVPESLRRNWEKEIRNVSPDADIKVCKSNDYQIGKDWTICGYSTIRKWKEEFKNEGFNVMFVDEAHNIKAVDNWGRPTSQQATAVMEVAENIKYVYPMTGTPIPTSNKDAYNILRLVRSDIVKKGFYPYAVDYCAGFRTPFGFNATGNSNDEELHEALSKVMVRRTKAEVLPNLKKQRTFIPLECINKKYTDIEKHLNHPAGNDTFMSLCMKGRNVLSELKVNDTIALADSMLNEGRSVVIVTEFNTTIDILKDHFKDNASIVRGGMTDLQKDRNVTDFQDGKTKVCLLNLNAGGVGLTLTKAHDMIINDYDWTPGNMTQVEDRICRSGQTEFCNIFYMYCEKALMDTIFIEMLSSKNANIDKVVDASDNTYDIKQIKGDTSTSADTLSIVEQLKAKAEERYHTEKEEKKSKKKSTRKSKDKEVPTEDKEVDKDDGVEK